MHYYEVLVGSKSYQAKTALTYASEHHLPVGVVVTVPLRNSKVLGIVARQVAKPAFATKPLAGLPHSLVLPASCLALLEWLRQYYPAGLGSIVPLFVPTSLLKQPKKTVVAPVNRVKHKAQPLPPLTAEQRNVLQAIAASRSRTFVVHGSTGSGKTRIYIELARQAIAHNQSVLVLTPEIGLTPQLVKTFHDVFGGVVMVGHSTLTEAERRRLWLTIQGSSKPVILIGPRSMLFYPFATLGLVVVDEAHESAYKQEQSPHYHGLRVASKLAQIHNCPLILGSATPSVEDYYIAQAKNVPILTMRQLAAGVDESPAVPVVVDMRELQNRTANPHLSDKLLEALKSTLQHNEQALLFLNRRGSARLVLCNVCGWQALCPNCDLPLTYHGDTHTLRCHICGYHVSTPTACPQCHNPNILFKSIGTKSLVDELSRLFPKARIRRFDTDNKKADRFEAHYQQVARGDIDILVGTQVLTKGLDLPYLSLVGIVAADSSLNFPDFTAEERTYQLLSQVLGRVSRGHRAGRAIIQTYNPDNTTIRAAIHRDWENFYTAQIKEREQFGFPPFRQLLKASVRRASSKSAREAAVKFKKSLQAMHLPVEIAGPSPSFHEKSQNTYQWQLVIKAKRRSHLLAIIEQLPANWSYDIDPTNLL